MSELPWLLDLFLNHKLPAKTKAHVAERLNEVAGQMTTRPVFVPGNTTNGSSYVGGTTTIVNGVPQAPSTAALMAKHGMGAVATTSIVPDEPQVQGIAAATAATAQAMESRQMAIKQAQLGKPEPGRTSPRKF